MHPPHQYNYYIKISAIQKSLNFKNLPLALYSPINLTILDEHLFKEYSNSNSRLNLI